MAVSVMARCGPGLSAPLTGSRRCHACQPRPVSFVRIARSGAKPSKAFYRSGSCYNKWDEESMKRMMQEMESAAKQWKETGKVSGGFFWPGGGYFYGGARAQGAQDTSSPPAAATNGPSSLPLDVVSTEGFYLIYADIPGLAKADLSIKLSKERVLTISGERQQPVEEGFSQKERRYGPFERTWQLPEDADSEGISAKVSEGVLTITVPKKQPEPEVDDSQEIAIN